jgi:ketosteroid isomerase-like protein
MIEIEWAKQFAEEWVAAWNNGDLERILRHCADDFEIISPVIVVQLGVVSGTLKGKEAIRPYWAQSVGVRPARRFELLDVLAGVTSVAIYYRGVVRTRHVATYDRNQSRSRYVVDRVEFNPQRQVIRAEALYRPE